MKRIAVPPMTAAVAALLAAPLALFAFLQYAPEHNHRIAVPVEHTVIVVITTIVAVSLAALILRTALLLRHTPTFLLGLGLLSIAGIFLVHGLSTPGILLGPNPVASIAGRLSLLLGAVFLALSAWSEDAPWARWVGQRMPAVLAVWSSLLALFGAVALLRPLAIEWLPLTSQPLSVMTFALALALYSLAALGFWRRWQETQFPLSGALAVASVLLLEAQVSNFLGEAWRLNWWEYHILMLVGFLIAVGALLWEFSAGRTLRHVIEGMYALRSLVELELEYTDAISVLAAATEAKDPYTHGHTVRVADLACRIGRELRLPPARLRVLVRAGLLHDVGKLGVPDAVLLKPGPLTAEEFAIIKEHPRQGHDILRRVGHLDEEINVLLAHHERVDGTGYPHGLKGEAIPLEARVLAVADVYDALTTTRPYRTALSQEEALEIIGRGRGSHFDPRCVDALLRLLRPADTPRPAPAPAVS